MPLLKMLEESSYDSATIAVVSAAYESARSDLGLTDRKDLITDTLARKIIEVAHTGERDPDRIRQQALDRLGIIIVPKE